MTMFILANLRSNFSRFVATIVAIALSVGFIVATLVIGATEKNYVEREVSSQPFDVVIAANPGFSPGSDTQVSTHSDIEQLIRKVKQSADVVEVETTFQQQATLHTQNGFVKEDETPVVLSTALPQKLLMQELVRGKWASSATQVVVEEGFAAQVGLSLGDQVTVSVGNSTAQPDVHEPEISSAMRVFAGLASSDTGRSGTGRAGTSSSNTVSSNLASSNTVSSSSVQTVERQQREAGWVGQKRWPHRASPGVPIKLTVVGVYRLATSGFYRGDSQFIVSDSTIRFFGSDASRLVNAQNVVSALIFVKGKELHGSVLASALKDSLSQPTLAIRVLPGIRNILPEDLNEEIDIFVTLILIFGVIAIFVAGLVIMNTIQVTVAQRTNELGLLRCVGASSRQLYQIILFEALTMSILASGLGVVIGVLVAAIAELRIHSEVSHHLFGNLVVTPGIVFVGMLVGIVVTVVFSAIPARRAIQIPPVAAFVTPVGNNESPSRVRITSGVILMVGGSMGLIGGAVGGGLIVGVPAGLLCFLGMVLLSIVVIPQALRVVGLWTSRISVPFSLANGNLLRNRIRTVATALTIIVGATLVSMTVVMLNSAKVSALSEIDLRRPVDVSITQFDDKGFSEEQVGQIAHLKNVAHSTLASEEQINLEVKGLPSRAITVTGVVPVTLRAVSHHEIALPGKGQVLSLVCGGDHGEQGKDAALVGGKGSVKPQFICLSDADKNAYARVFPNAEYIVDYGDLDVAG